jgi:hypothetical protein
MKQSQRIDNDSFQIDLLINYTIGMIAKCPEKAILIWPHLVQLLASIALVIIFSYCNKRNTKYPNDRCSRLGIYVFHFNSHYNTFFV